MYIFECAAERLISMSENSSVSRPILSTPPLTYVSRELPSYMKASPKKARSWQVLRGFELGGWAVNAFISLGDCFLRFLVELVHISGRFSAILKILIFR